MIDSEYELNTALITKIQILLKHVLIVKAFRDQSWVQGDHPAGLLHTGRQQDNPQGTLAIFLLVFSFDSL